MQWFLLYWGGRNGLRDGMAFLVLWWGWCHGMWRKTEQKLYSELYLWSFWSLHTPPQEHSEAAVNQKYGIITPTPPAEQQQLNNSACDGEAGKRGRWRNKMEKVIKLFAKQNFCVVNAMEALLLLMVEVEWMKRILQYQISMAAGKRRYLVGEGISEH